MYIENIVCANINLINIILFFILHGMSYKDNVKKVQVYQNRHAPTYVYIIQKKNICISGIVLTRHMTLDDVHLVSYIHSVCFYFFYSVYYISIAGKRQILQRIQGIL